MSLVTIFVISAIASTIVGTLIGQAKGYTSTGVVLGLILGWIGVIILACMSPSDEKRVERMQRDMALREEAQRRFLGGSQ
jgi:hypothetical protein